MIQLVVVGRRNGVSRAVGKGLRLGQFFEARLIFNLDQDPLESKLSFLKAGQHVVEQASRLPGCRKGKPTYSQGSPGAGCPITQ